MADSSYQFQVGDLIKYRDPDTGITYTGRIVRPYGRYTAVSQGDAREECEGYGVDLDNVEHRNPKRPYIAFASGLSLRPDLAAARADNAFQMLLHGILTAPRRGRRPKSPHGPDRHAPAE